jgi:hypothetical protein
MIFLDDSLKARDPSHRFSGSRFEVVDIVVMDEAKVWRAGWISAGMYRGFCGS